MPVKHTRIDDRLIHGQVLIGWGSRYDYDAYIICDQQLAKSDWEKEMYLAAVPGDKKGAVLTPLDLKKYLSEHPLENIILLLKSPETLEKLIKEGVPLKEVNIGGLHDKPDKKHFYDYVYLNEEDKKTIKRLISQGLHIYCQDLPEHPIHEICNML